MKKIIFFISILFIFYLSVQAQSDQEIIRNGFNGEFRAADSILAVRIQADPDNPKNYYLRQQLYYYSRYFRVTDLSNDSLLALVAQNALKTIELVANSEESTENKFYAGRSYDFLSRTQIYSSRWDAFWSARHARILLEEVLDEDPEFYDAYISLGVPIYFTARLSSFLRAIAWTAGMGGDRERGLEYFHLVADKGRLCKAEALFALTALYRYFENDFKQALSFSREFLSDHPNNFFILNLQGQLNFMVLIEDKGVQFLRAEFDSLRSQYGVNNAGILNQLGYSFLNQEQFDDALVIFKTNLELFPDVANCYDSYAEAFMQSGDNENAIKYYQVAYAKLESDTSISDDFRQQLSAGIRDRLAELGADL